MGKYSASLIFIYRSHALLAKVRTFSPKVIVNKLEFWCNKKIQSAALNPIAALNCAATVDIENDYFFHQLSQNMTIYFTYVLYMFSIKIFWIWYSNPCHGSSIVLFNFRFFVKKIEYCYEETKKSFSFKICQLNIIYWFFWLVQKVKTIFKPIRSKYQANWSRDMTSHVSCTIIIHFPTLGTH